MYTENYLNAFMYGMTKLAKYNKLDDRYQFQGLPLSIERKKGSIRSGISPEGKKWETKMCADYGYIRGTRGVDGDELDVFVGPNKDSKKVFVVHQLDHRTGKYDEDKCILGVNSEREAKNLFLLNYKSKKFFGSITEMRIEDFKRAAIHSYWRPKKLVHGRKRNPIKASNVDLKKVLNALKK